MTAAAPFADDAFNADDHAAPANDWVAEAAAGPAEYELYLDEATGLYEIRRVPGSEAPPHAVAPQPDLAPQPEPLLEVQAQEASAREEPLTPWASLAGPTGPSAFHMPLLWALRLSGEADFSPLPALEQSRGGSAWPLEAAA